MRWSHDQSVDAAHFSLTDEPVVRTEALDDGSVVDLDAADRVVGIEIIGIDQGWSPDVVFGRFAVDIVDQGAIRFVLQHLYVPNERPLPVEVEQPSIPDGDLVAVA